MRKITKKERDEFNDWLEGKTNKLSEHLNPDTLPPEMEPLKPLFGQYWHWKRKKNLKKKLKKK